MTDNMDSSTGFHQNHPAKRVDGSIMPPDPYDEETFRSLVIALLQEGPTRREERHFLEHHLELIDPYTIIILEQFLLQTQGSPAQKDVSNVTTIIQDVLTHGHTVAAVRDAYINAWGGFMLPIPTWLETEIAALDTGKELTAWELGSRWEAAYTRALQEALEPAIIATIAVRAGQQFYQVGDQRRAVALEHAITWFKRADSTFTEMQYPRQWAKIQNSLGVVYHGRIHGSAAENQERAIAYFTDVQRVYTQNNFPAEWAMNLTNLGEIYRARVQGDKEENQERAIICYKLAFRVRRRSTHSGDWARTINNLGLIYTERKHGKQRVNQKHAIACFTAALEILTEDRAAHDWAQILHNLGEVYAGCKWGDREQHREQAIACYHNALRILTEDQFPLDWAKMQSNLGEVYVAQGTWEQRNLAITCFLNALEVFRIASFPREHRDTSRLLAALYCTLGRWEDAVTHYANARRAEQLQLVFVATAPDQDALLNDRQDAMAREAYALARVERWDEAVLVIEQCHARSLALARAQTSANPDRIRDQQRRDDYIAARAAWQEAQQLAYDPIDPYLSEADTRQVKLARYAAIAASHACYDVCVADIVAARDPADFLQTEIRPSVLFEALTRCPGGHALVYLVATPWGGCALMSQRSSSSATIMTHQYDLPHLRDYVADDLVEDSIISDAQYVIGGLAWGQLDRAFTRFRRYDWVGETFAQRAGALHVACEQAQREGSFDQAAQAIMKRDEFKDIVERSYVDLERTAPHDLELLRGAFNHEVLVREIRRVSTTLREVAMQPLTTWLQTHQVTGVTLIPCGALATFPLLATRVDPSGSEQTFAEAFPNGASIAPNAHALVPAGQSQPGRSGVCAVGNPAESGGKPLRWGQAEAMTLAHLAGDVAAARILFSATRKNVLEDLKSAWIYEASSHGNGGDGDFLDYGLFLARGERLTLRDIFNGQLTNLQGLRLFILSACQTGIIDLRGAHDEVRSLAVGLLQAGCEAVLAAQWSVDEYATYLLIVRFFQLWQLSGFTDPPALALARMQAWLRALTWVDLIAWQSTQPLLDVMRDMPETTSVQDDATMIGVKRDGGLYISATGWLEQAIYHTFRGKGLQPNMTPDQAQTEVRDYAQKQSSTECPFADPFYWAGFSLNGW